MDLPRGLELKDADVGRKAAQLADDQAEYCRRRRTAECNAVAQHRRALHCSRALSRPRILHCREYADHRQKDAEELKRHRLLATHDGRVESQEDGRHAHGTQRCVR